MKAAELPNGTSAKSADDVPAAAEIASEDFPERESHEVAAIFPMMDDAQIADLAKDIKANGLRDDIITAGGKIADGRNRYAACRLAGVIPRFKEWDGKGSLVSWVLSVNLQRRHLTDQQRAMVAANAKVAFEAEAEVRQISKLLQNKGATVSADLRSRDGAYGPQDLRTPPSGTSEGGKSATKAAEALKVSTRAVEQASRVLKQGDASLIDAVNQGTVSLDAAAKVSKLPRPEQKKIVQAGNVKEAAAKLRKVKAAQKQPKPAAEPEPTAAPESEPAASRPTAGGSFAGLIAALPEQHREAAKILVKETIALVQRIPVAKSDDADLALRGLRALVAQTSGFLKGGGDGGFLREAVEQSTAAAS